MENRQPFLEEIERVVLPFDEKADMILYGLCARGDYREDSDWNILMLTEKKFDHNKRSFSGYYL